jgi:hypothetical protein
MFGQYERKRKDFVEKNIKRLSDSGGLVGIRGDSRRGALTPLLFLL